MISEDSNTSVLRAALTKVVGGEWTVTVDGESAPGAEDASAGPSGRGPAPMPAEPDPRDDEDYDAAPAATATPPADPETEAIRLITSEFDAKPIDTP
jgi:DNA polymerase-3 subunit gamma/tau